MIEGFSLGRNWIEIYTNGNGGDTILYEFSEPSLALPGYLYFELGWVYIGKYWIKDITNELIAYNYLDIDNVANGRWTQGMLGDRF